MPVAFRRLCVETKVHQRLLAVFGPAAFRRLCVETNNFQTFQTFFCQPPSGGCVLKPPCRPSRCSGPLPSRLQAAVC